MVDNETQMGIPSHVMSVLEVRQAGPSQPLTDAMPPDPQARVVSATVRCIAKWGVAKTTLDDVARECGWSRATVYRVVPGGKEGLLAMVAEAELVRFFAAVDAAAADVDGLENTLVAGIVTATHHLRSHSALQFLIAHEPEQILPRFAFNQLDLILNRVSSFCIPHLAPWLGAGEEAARVAEWLTRIVLSYVCMPSPAFDLGDETAARRLVRTFVLPGLAVSSNAN